MGGHVLGDSAVPHGLEELQRLFGGGGGEGVHRVGDYVCVATVAGDRVGGQLEADCESAGLSVGIGVREGRDSGRGREPGQDRGGGLVEMGR